MLGVPHQSEKRYTPPFCLRWGFSSYVSIRKLQQNMTRINVTVLVVAVSPQAVTVQFTLTNSLTCP
ncbi:MAG: hypothetical protein MK111_24680 [Crocosphaera sp.]|uniref:hypothetical protein n=1 Tax=Crocosphaera TaxID=263510 RepID=UPI000A772286|nr:MULTISPECIES: hypothetical protein [Crocosphaera]MCH2247784.1 hypothetical protein [Crocosphaera sp.]